MTTFTWGELAKSQIDAETIEECIDRKISEHEEAPTSHLGTGESIDQHRTNDILDHKAGAVLADKKSMTEFSIQDDFRIISQWDSIGDLSILNWPALGLYVEYGAVNKSEIFKQLIIPTPYLSKDYSQMFQITAYSALDSDSFHAWFGIGLEDELPQNGYGFIITSGVLTACVCRTGTRVFSDTLTIDLSVAHIYRAIYTVGEGTIKYYIDGSLVAELTPPVGAWDMDDGPRIGVRLVSENAGNLIVGDLSFSRAIINL